MSQSLPPDDERIALQALWTDLSEQDRALLMRFVRLLAQSDEDIRAYLRGWIVMPEELVQLRRQRRPNGS